MDQKTKNFIYIAIAIVALVIVVKLVWKFWLFVLVGGGCFIAGYLFALAQGRDRKKK